MDVSSAAFTLNMMCRDISYAIQDHAQIVTQSGAKMSPAVSSSFARLCIALKDLDEVTGKELSKSPPSPSTT